jgi:hypothetical protein
MREEAELFEEPEEEDIVPEVTEEELIESMGDLELENNQLPKCVTFRSS